jgi:hypothetical protein
MERSVPWTPPFPECRLEGRMRVRRRSDGARRKAAAFHPRGGPRAAPWGPRVLTLVAHPSLRQPSLALHP